MKYVYRIIPLIIILLTILIYKWTLTYHFDPVYFKDYFEHSQWNITLSPRIISDEGLYQYSGYRLASGDNPYNINPETPPLSKYIYGISIVLFKNPYLPIIPLYLVTTLLFYLITNFYFDNKKSRLISLIFLLISPLYFSQVSQTMLELPQLCFLLAHIFFLFKLINQKGSKAFLYSLLAGFSLGAFYTTKIGLLVPVIILADTYLLYKFKKIIYLPLIVIYSGLIYLSTYAKYFLDGHSIFEWITGQKYIVKFYMTSQIHPLPGMVFLSLLLGIFKGWWGSGWERIKEWNIIMALGTIALLIKIKKPPFKNLNFYYQYLVTLCLGIIFLYIFIPFWFRYLTLLLPFLIILAVKFLENKKASLINFLSVILVIQTLFFISFQPHEEVNLIASLWERSMYQELYDFQSNKLRSNISRHQFYLDNLNFDTQIGLLEKKIIIEAPNVYPWQASIEAKITLKYKTGVGEMTRVTSTSLVKEDNKWKLSDWSNLLFGLESKDKVVVTIEPVSDGIMKTQDGLILSKTGEAQFISIIPNLVKNEEFFKDLGKITGQDNLKLRARTYVLYPGDWKVPVGFVKPGHDQILLNKLSKNPAVIIEKRQTRIYNQELVENGYHLRIIEAESKYPELRAKPGGKIEIVKSAKTIEIFSSIAINGQDVKLDRDGSDIFPEFTEQLKKLKIQGKFKDWYVTPLTVPSQNKTSDIKIIAKNLDTPWAVAFLPDKSILITERAGKVRLVNKSGLLQSEPIATINKVKEIGEGGLLGIALHPNFSSNNYIYLYYTYSADNNNTLNRVVRMTYTNGKLEEEKIIVDKIPGAANHNGGRIKFGPDNYLYITTGDAQEPSRAQDINSLAGKILRVTDEGQTVANNPFNNQVFSYGHRNPQGLAWDKYGRLWATEHGRSGVQSGLDEINLIEKGKNYGWPEIQGSESKEKMETARLNSGSDTWAPAGAVFLGQSLFFGGLRGEALYEAEINNDQITLKEHYKKKFGRIRDVVLDPDDTIYFTISNLDGRGVPNPQDDLLVRIPQKR